ncbi:HNH endonuclease [Pseudomonas sp.]|uniref:HNH endonuclease n=1 Tax=Pseudomonas sp. TaxID=306 RepID=UPI003C76949F
MEEILMKCIICRNEKSQNCFNDEHVIPDSLGGYYHIYSVCIDCNSKLGEKVDSPLVNHKLSELYRFGQEIAGKSGKIPNPFAGTFVGKDSPTKKARLEVGSDGTLELYQAPEIQWGEKDGKILLSISVDPKDEGKIDQIVAKTLARKKIPAEAIVRGEKTLELDQSAYTSRWSIDINKFKIGLLKIAYEFAVDSLPSYFEDDAAIRASEILRDANYDDVLDYVKIGNGLQDKIWDPFNQFLDLDSRTHYLVLASSDTMGLVCLIKLHDLFAVGVVLSTKPYLEEGEMIVGINSLDARSFIKISGQEMVSQCLGPRYTRPLYHLDFNTIEESVAEINNPSFRYEGQDNKREIVPLYSWNGELICYLEDAVRHARNEVVQDGNKYIQTSWFARKPEYFVKSVKTGNLFQVIAYEVEQIQIRKL